MASKSKPAVGRKKGATTAAAYAVPALTKAMEVLELLADEPAGLTATDIATTLDRSMGEIYRIIVALQRLELLVRDERNERYALSLKLFEMSHRHPPTARLIHSALPVLGELAKQSEQSAHLGALDGDNLVVLAQVDSPLAMRYSVRVGAVFPVLETSAGVCIVAHSDARVQEHHLSALSGEQRRDMERRFKDAVRFGYERSSSAWVTGIINLSRPVFNHAGVPQGGVTVPYLQHTRSTVDADRALDMMIAAADELSQSMGWSKPPARAALRS